MTKASKNTLKRIKAGVARSNKREKTEPKAMTGSRQELIVKMGEASYRLGCIQDEMRRINQIHDRAQQEVQALKAALDKRGEEK